MQRRQFLQVVIKQIQHGNLKDFFSHSSNLFTPTEVKYAHYLDDSYPNISQLTKLGEIEYSETERLVVVAGKCKKELNSRTGKKRQYDLARLILKAEYYDAGIFVFYDDSGHFRFSLVVAQYFGTKRIFSNFRRYTYFVDPALPNKTFLNQVGRADFSGIERLQEAFSIEAVSDEFYREFKPRFDQIADAVQGTEKESLKQDFALLFVIRIIFLGFVQKKGWLGDNPRFLQDFREEYRQNCSEPDSLYRRWLEPLFFEALNKPPGQKVAYGNNEFSEDTEKALQMAPYLNGELFRSHKGVDDLAFWIPDQAISDFFEFLFQYNFTIEENTLYDEELELNPEFLGIIFERLVSKADGAVYTPRVEVDFMCRLALVKWLEKNSPANTRDLYTLFFREAGIEEEFDEVQKQGDFSAAEIRELIALLESVTVCDPAATRGSCGCVTAPAGKRKLRRSF